LRRSVWPWRTQLAEIRLELIGSSTVPRSDSARLRRPDAGPTGLTWMQP